MADFLDGLRREMFDLLANLSATWPIEDTTYVRELVDHGEYAEALDELIATGLQGRKFSSDQAQRIRALASVMNMGGSEWVSKLREQLP